MQRCDAGLWQEQWGTTGIRCPSSHAARDACCVTSWSPVSVMSLDFGLPIRKPRRPIWKCHLQAQPTLFVRISMVSHSLQDSHGAKTITFLIELFPHCDNAKGLFWTNTIICIQPVFQKNLFMRILSKLMCEIGYFSIERQCLVCLLVLGHLKLYS